MKTLLNNTIYSEKITQFLSIDFEILIYQSNLNEVPDVPNLPWSC
jgi:hypothetical protein